MTTQINTLFKVHHIKDYTRQKDEECGLNFVDTVNVEFSKLPELDSELGILELMELGITMQKNFNKYSSIMRPIGS